MNNKILKRVRPDERGRITLGDISKSVSSYDVQLHEDGTILLIPYIEIPKSEIWLHNNKEALNSVLTGIEQAKQGKIKTLGSFAEYADDEID